MTRKAPRYDIPNAAPEPLRLVQQFVNTVNLESREDWLDRWFEGEGVSASADEVDRARPVREAVRELLYANNRQPVEGDPLPVLAAAADAASFSIDFSRPELVASADRVEGAVGRVLAITFLTMLDGSW